MIQRLSIAIAQVKACKSSEWNQLDYIFSVSSKKNYQKSV